MQSIEEKIYRRICGHGKGWVFINKDFSDISSAQAVDTNLHRLEKAGKIRRICRGIYDFPKYSDFLKQLISPSINEIAHAIARRSGWRIYPEGNLALNQLGISTQVPGRLIYLADGINRSQEYKIGNQTLEIKKASIKDMNLKHAESLVLVQALKALGADYITDDVISKLQTRFTSQQKKRILKDTTYVTEWIRQAIVKICLGKENNE